MKKLFICSLLALGFIGCKSYETYEERASRVPYGGFGEYGFTYDLDNSPSPFENTSYRPLTAFDLTAPIIVVVTNQPPTRYIFTEPTPVVGETRYSGATPAGATSIVAPSPIVESAGAQVNSAPGVAPGTPATGSATAPNYSYGGDTVILPSSDVNVSQTNEISGTNISSTNSNTVTNSNAFGFATNTNAFGGITNTNAFAGGTNRQINEPAGTELQTNRPFGEPPGTQFRTNRFGEPAVPPNSGTTPTPQINAPTPTIPPASAPQNPPAPTTP